jgi:hypothetical protein
MKETTMATVLLLATTLQTMGRIIRLLLHHYNDVVGGTTTRNRLISGRHSSLDVAAAAAVSTAISSRKTIAGGLSLHGSTLTRRASTRIGNAI